MSSILDALEKLEATGGPQPPGGGPPRRRRPRRRWRVLLLFGGAIVAGAGGAAWLLRAAPADDPAGTPAPAVVAQVAPTLPLPAPLAATSTVPLPTPLATTTVPDPTPGTSTTLEPSQPPIAKLPRAAAPVPAPKADDPERPWAWDAEPVPSPDEPGPVLAVARAVPEPPPAVAPPPVPPPADPPPAPAVPEPPVARETPPEPEAPAAGPPIGAPRLRVSFLVYSSAPERRSVALTIDGGGLTTLREGDEAQGISVVRIRPDRVDLRWQGATFTLEVRS